MMRGVRVTQLLPLFLILWLLTGCALKSLFVSAVSLEAVGVQFAAVSEQVTQGCEKRVITVQTCERYRVFGENFKRAYPLAVGVWKAARTADDTASQEKAEDVVRALARDLAKLTAEALASFLPTEGN